MAVCADIISTLESHASLDNLFTYSGASGEPPAGSKPVKALEWLRKTNKDPSADPLKVLGRIIESFMDSAPDDFPYVKDYRLKAQERMLKTLAENQLNYFRGGVVNYGISISTKTLSDFIRGRDFASIENEFNRALETVEAKPREAISAASNILESVCKVIIEDEKLEMPSKQDLQGVWGVVRKYLGIDPSSIQDRDLQQILSGVISVVTGIGALRTHASSAHGAGSKIYRIEPRHARLAVHSSHTIALYVLESWEKKKSKD